MNTMANKRFQENEKKIQESFISLLNTYDVNQITVRAICEKAKINRSTFYAHYQDVYDLLDRLEIAMNNKIVAQYKGREIDEIFFISDEFFIPFLDFISKNQIFYKACLQKRKSFPISQGFEALWNIVIKPISLKHGITSEDEMMYYFVFFQAGITMVLKRWVDNGCIETPSEISSYIMNCLSRFR
ncbi:MULTISPECIES: TetR-like C-terminal domain-containing protein [Clostridium]|uniref:TetR/AcrR family transcriptional regulator C-terminal domain-containing protein n=1 Tax=Clostridium cibarium TaxID=2762247 RepID=A0ABR8PTC0_9CLOT|nr:MULTISPECIES: TetR-like C-terminal domain-containing protein [Clostridium]MBD7911417.1 TetR/AcrR family transcriptional regulator C-terminal domain-containing protein [Clostridium cibarium]